MCAIEHTIRCILVAETIVLIPINPTSTSGLVFYLFSIINHGVQKSHIGQWREKKWNCDLYLDPFVCET